MVWRELYDDSGAVTGLFDDTAYGKVKIQRIPIQDCRSSEHRWGVVALRSDGRDETVIRGGFASESAARDGFNFDHWSRDRASISLRDDDGLERDR